MLVLSRHKDSSVKIGPDVTVTVLSIRRQHVRLGIEAPKNVRVLRDELDVEPAEEPPQVDPVQQPRAAGMKIVMVIEDDPLHAKLIRKALCRNQGTMVTVVETAKRANWQGFAPTITCFGPSCAVVCLQPWLGCCSPPD